MFPDLCMHFTKLRTMALIYDYEIKEVSGILTEVGLVFLAALKGLEDGEEDGGVCRDLAVLADAIRGNAAQGIIGKPEEAVECLVCKDIPVCQEEDTGPVAGLPHIPPRMEEFVSNLEGDEGLAGSRCHDQQSPPVQSV